MTLLGCLHASGVKGSIDYSGGYQLDMTFWLLKRAAYPSTGKEGLVINTTQDWQEGSPNKCIEENYSLVYTSPSAEVRRHAAQLSVDEHSTPTTKHGGVSIKPSSCMISWSTLASYIFYPH